MARILNACLCLALSATLFAANTLTDAEWASLKQQAKERPRLAIYDNDSDDALCFPKAKLPATPEKYLALRTSYLHKYPIDTIVCNATYGCFDQLVFKNDAGVLVDYDWNDWNPQATVVNIVPELVRQGTGVMEEQLKYARAHGIEFFAGIRINDVHDVVDTPEKPLPFFSKWKRSNPQLLMGPDRKSLPWGEWSAVDFGHKEVRDKFVAIVEEIVKRYPVDGISIDLQRTCRFFKSVSRGELPSEAELEMLREMFRRVRQVTERYGRERGRPVLIALRGLDSVGYSRALGFDWEGVMRDGSIDIFYAGGTIHLTPWKESVDLCHKYGVKCYASIDEPLCGYPAPRLGRNKAASYYARIAAAYQQGVDGIYYFNLFNEASARDLMLGGPEKYRDLDKRYHLNPTILWPPNYILKDGIRFNKLPLLSPRFKQTLKARQSMEFVVEWADDLEELAARGFPVELSAMLLAQRPAQVAIASNGVKWEPQAAFGDTATFKVPRNAFHPGLNTVVLTSLSDEDMQIVDADIDLTLHPQQAEALEEITDWTTKALNTNALAAGNYAYQITPMDAEFEVMVPQGEAATAYLSIGGMLTMVRFCHDHLEFPFGGTEPVAIKPLTAPRRFRFYEEEHLARLYIDGHWLELGTRSVSLSLKDKLSGLQGELFQIVRNGGIIFDGPARVTEIKIRMRK